MGHPGPRPLLPELASFSRLILFDKRGIGLRVPTLVLHRSGDLVVSVAEGRRLAREITGARYVELPGVDHLVWVGDQDAVVEEVRTFVAGLTPGKARTDRMPATIMFTDVAGSTEMAVRLGDAAWRELLVEHHRVVRAGARGRARRGGRDRR